MITYGEGIPTESISTSYYIDLETDTIYQKRDGIWVATHRNGNEIVEE